MKNLLEELRFQLIELWLNIKSSTNFLSEKTMWITLSSFFVAWISICAIIFIPAFLYDTEKAEADDLEERINVPLQTFEQADLLINNGSTSEAFILLITHLNHFTESYKDYQMESLRGRLDELIVDVETGDIDTLYEKKDLSEVQPIQRFVGIINSVDNDELYGETYVLSTTGERKQEQLEVSGLHDVALGSQVEFYGVPVFDTISSPIKIEAYVPVILEEVE